MKWLNEIVDEVIKRHPDGEIIVESGVSPSGKYHVGTLREVLSADAIRFELRSRGRSVRHIHYVDDLDPLRKIPAGVPAGFEQYIGRPYQDIPAPDGSDQSYADFFLNDFLGAARQLKMDMQVIRSHEKYRSGFMVPALEKALLNINELRRDIENVSGRKLDEGWAPIQVMEDGYLKSRRFKSIDTDLKTIVYLDPNGRQNTINYSRGDVKLNWRVDWPSRWWLLGVHVEPFGRDHATKGGSYDTGAAIIRRVFDAQPPIPLPYNFINRSGQTKKMSKSSGDTISISEMLEVLPPEVVRFFTLRFRPGKQLFFDETDKLTKLIDDFAQLLAKENKTKEDQQLINLSTAGLQPTISPIPFSHLAASYQASLKDPQKTLDVIKRSEYKTAAKEQSGTILKELKFIDRWLNKWAPDEVKFELLEVVSKDDFSKEEVSFLHSLADVVEKASQDAGGEWFHKAIYGLNASPPVSPQQKFKAIYRATIGKESGPRAGWFLSILPRDWLVKRLRLEQ